MKFIEQKIRLITLLRHKIYFPKARFIEYSLIIKCGIHRTKSITKIVDYLLNNNKYDDVDTFLQA